MTTPELVRLIEAVASGSEYPEQVTIGELAYRAEVPRRAIEEAIQTARLEGCPVITDGGIRVARTADEAYSLARWLMARMATQQATHAAVLAQAHLMERGEAAGAAPTLWDAA